MKNKTPLIEIKNIKKHYCMGTVTTKALNSVSLKIFEGEFISVIGPSGSGKSTLMNILGFLDTATSGTYMFENKILKQFDEDTLAEIRNKKIGFIFQQFHLLKRTTALENVKLPLIYAGISEKEQDALAKKALIAVGLKDRMSHKPNELSGGEQQRVAIARALANNANLIFADEPTGNLDSKSSDEIMDIIHKLHQKGHTIIMVTHNKKLAETSERIIEIKDGVIVKDRKIQSKKLPKK